MRAFACILAASLVAGGAAEAAPTRVASLNLCTDELLLMLAEPRQILSVHYLSHIPHETPLWRTARRYRKNDRSLLSVAAVKPDIVLTMGGGAPDTIGIARRLGIRVVDLPYPQSLSDMESGIARVAAALGRREAGAALLSKINMLKRTVPTTQQETIWLGGGGRTVSPAGLSADWMRLAGLRQRSVRGDRVSLEQLLVSPPSILLRSDYRSGQFSGEQRGLSHPLASRTRRSRSVRTDGRLWTCMGPTLIPEIWRLRRELAK